jgi:RNA polymerase sigma-70 factor, ECF subfamily
MDSSAIVGFRNAITSGRNEGHRSAVLLVRADEGSEPDEDLISRICGGDMDALSGLFRRYARLVHGVGQRILRDTGEADDLVQDVFLYIYRKSTLFDGSRGSARSWIFQIAYTQAFLRRRRRNSAESRVSGIVDNLYEIELRTFSGADYDQTVEGLFGRSGWQKVQEALTEDQRETLRLFFFEGYTFAEIAEKLGQSFCNVRHHYYRGLEKLRRNLAENVLNRR